MAGVAGEPLTCRIHRLSVDGGRTARTTPFSSRKRPCRYLLIGDMLLVRPDKAAFLSRSILSLILLSEIPLIVEPRPTTNAQRNAAMIINVHTTSPWGAKKPTTISVETSNVTAMMVVARLISRRIWLSSARCSCEGDCS